MTTPGVGVLVALTFVAAVDAPEQFRSSRAVGPHFGLTPKKYQSGETDHSGRISKIGDGSVRTALYEAAHVVWTLNGVCEKIHPGRHWPFRAGLDTEGEQIRNDPWSIGIRLNEFFAPVHL